MLSREGPLIAREIAKRLGRPTGRIQSALYSMTTAGLLQRRDMRGVLAYENAESDE